MKNLFHSFCISALAMLASCSGNDSPEYPVYMQPSAITVIDGHGDTQTFDYDKYGRIVAWSLKSDESDNATTCIARYSYSNDISIHITSEEICNENKRCYEETIQLVKGRASESNGTFISYINGITELRKTYHLEFEYDPANHLTIVKHTEVVGIGDEIKDTEWNKPWTWENYLIWEDGNLREFEDYQGNSKPMQTIRYDYSMYAAEYPVVIPLIINNAHHSPLFMQGVFGLNSVNLLKTESVSDNNGNIYLSHNYTYDFEQGRIIEFTKTTFYNASFSDAVTYKVNWIDFSEI